ncbi:MAG: hypothetical protein WBF42_19145 [Terracidiphilus sp.]
MWLFWGLGIYLALELAACRIAAQVLNRTADQFAGPYLAFAVPWVIFAPLIWWLRKWEEQGETPKRLARGWSLGMALFGVAVEAAVFYSGTVLRLMDPTDVAGGFIATVLLSVPILYFGMYYTALRSISARAVSKRGNV